MAHPRQQTQAGLRRHTLAHARATHEESIGIKDLSRPPKPKTIGSLALTQAPAYILDAGARMSHGRYRQR
jgi:hypothetical protein